MLQKLTRIMRVLSGKQVRPSTIHVYDLGFQRIVNEERKRMVRDTLNRTETQLKKLGIR
jgi:hypothetical protein